MGTFEPTDLLPSVAQILKRAGAFERAPGVDVQGVSRLPVFQSRSWKRAIGEFLRWSGSTPDAWGATSIFELLLCHGSAGARALFEAYRHDRLERAGTFQEASAQLEAVRTVISMAAYWLHVIDWDLRDAARLSSEEFQARRRTAWSAPAARPVSDEPLSWSVPRPAATDAAGRPAPAIPVPVFPGEAAMPSLWKTAPEKPEIGRSDPGRPRTRVP